MTTLEKAFSLIGKIDKILLLAEVDNINYKGDTKIVLQRLWNGKYAIYKNGFGFDDPGYILFPTEEDFYKVVKIKEVQVTNHSAGYAEGLNRLLSPSFVFNI